MSPTEVPRAAPRLPRALSWLGAMAWLAATGIGVAAMFRYGAEPGARSEPPVAWPADASVARDARRPTLLLFAHPHCVCTQATLAELARILARAPDRATVHAFFYADTALGADWVESATWRQAHRLAGVHVHADPLAATARAFGATTSGSVVLYGSDGRLRFHGGITGSRGHEGDNAGANAVVDLLVGRAVATASEPVFGCALVAATEVAR